MTNYYFREFKVGPNQVTARKCKELTALGHNHEKYHKYQTEYKFHGWIPPITVLPPRDNSITDIYI